MAALGVVMRLSQLLQSLQFLQCAGLYVHGHAALSGGDGEPENRISGNALFTEVPRDVATQSGQDVEMACSFRGAGPPSHLLEIQWWYTKEQEDQQEDQSLLNYVSPLEDTSTGATKISVVKVAGSDISHKLRLSGVTPADGGAYECRVIDFSGGAAGEGRHRARARLQVAPERSRAPREPSRRRPLGDRQTEEGRGPERGAASGTAA